MFCFVVQFGHIAKIGLTARIGERRHIGFLPVCLLLFHSFQNNDKSLVVKCQKKFRSSFQVKPQAQRNGKDNDKTQGHQTNPTYGQMKQESPEQYRTIADI
jgi:hypothetical protein